MTDAERWETSTDPDELLGMVRVAHKRKLLDLAPQVWMELYREIVGRVWHIEACTLSHIGGPNGNLDRIAQWARTVEVEDAKEWAIRIGCGSAYDKSSTRRAEEYRIDGIAAYAEHAARAYQCACIRRAVGNPFEEGA